MVEVKETKGCESIWNDGDGYGFVACEKCLLNGNDLDEFELDCKNYREKYHLHVIIKYLPIK